MKYQRLGLMLLNSWDSDLVHYRFFSIKFGSIIMPSAMEVIWVLYRAYILEGGAISISVIVQSL